MQRADIHRFAITSIDGLLTGACELMVDNNAARVRMWIGSKHWNRDYGEDALQGLANLIFDRFPTVEKITCTATQKDSALGDMLETIGFKLDESRERYCLDKADRDF